MTYSAVLFDLDGTLLDTLEDLADSVNRVLTHHGYPTHDASEYRGFVGDGSVNLIIRALPEAHRDGGTVAACVEGFKDDYSRNWHVKTAIYGGVARMLTALSERGMKMAVLSNKLDGFTRQCVEYFLPRWPFQVVMGNRDGVPLKPDPRAALEVAERMGIEPGRFLYLGDSGVDMKTALGAGMYGVGVLWGFRGRAELEETGARAIVSHPREVLELL